MSGSKREPGYAEPVRANEYPDYKAAYFPAAAKLAQFLPGFTPAAALAAAVDYFHPNKDQTYTAVDGVKRPGMTALIRDIVGAVTGFDSSNHAPSRVFNQAVVQGRKEPFTERDFSPQEIAHLRTAIGRAEAEGRTSLAFSDYVNPEYMNYIKSIRGPDGRLIKGKLRMQAPKRDDTGGWSNMIGRANFRREPDGSYRVTDTYDFNNYDMGKPGLDAESAWLETSIANPAAAGSWLGRRALPSGLRGIPVDIRVGLPSRQGG